MRVLCKFPTRGRPQRFLLTLKGWMSNAENQADVKYLCNYDDDDELMTPTIIKDAVAMAANLGANLVMEHGKNANKIAAFNAHMDKADDWDVCLLVSDDFFCRRKGWDDMIRRKMAELYPDTDGCLWFHDGSKQRVVMTQSCIGKRYFDRTRYVYHHSYASFFCDNEETDRAKALGKITFIEQGIASHEHPAWGGGMKVDATYQRNRGFWAQDEANYYKRKTEGFPI